MAATKAATPPPRSFEKLTLDVPCYSEIKKNLSNGRCVESAELVANGHSWRISFYPNGKVGSTTDAASISLRLDDADAGDDNLHVQFKFMLQEVGGGPPHFVSSTFTRSFNRKKTIGLSLLLFVSHEDLDKSVLAKHDRFTVRCDLAVLPPPGSEATAGAAVPPPPSHLTNRSDALLNLSGLPADLGLLLETKQGADVEFEVCGQIFAAHKLVLASRSSVFNDDFFGPMKEKTTSYIRVSDMKPEAFKSLLRYMYTDTLPKMPFASREEGAALAEGLLVAADRYNLKALKSLTEKLMCEHISARTALPMLVLAEQHQCHKLKKKCLKFITSHKNTRATIAKDDVEHLARSCPAVVKEVITNILDTREEEFELMVWLTCTLAFGFLFSLIVIISMAMMK